MLRTTGGSRGDVAYEGREQGRCCVRGEGAGEMLRTRGGSRGDVTTSAFCLSNILVVSIFRWANVYQQSTWIQKLSSIHFVLNLKQKAYICALSKF